ncbi:hypothetical protein GLOTRDRAFT_113163 [Gloeophyllum trabeum ATCC 11539]|uniref:Uncharacterized protein n=1 Tax=Gloeophyllum trabeum (strain ATCC 11539 / FP-39264 / Madison 617) TaxID=670483 RepID=S7RZT9_GLOTA|nr:uncharacterized protein GLOTRDRAFT_113163 [Gloeophyllum trabeum ATCC 11539]EPQ60555.1 hypothetical protein GLOTRDRAFT_113163 [Gloeophyllum trabeum ATCC 11539]
MRSLTFSWILCFLPSVAKAFSFSFGTPTQCDDLTVTWTGGTAPFQLSFIPVFGTPRNISIPSSAFSDGKGSYQTQVPFESNHKIAVVMSDATGFGSGGVSELIAVGKSVGNKQCNTTDPGVAFEYQLNTALQQCRPYTFSAYSGAVQPVTIMGLVPGGQIFYLHPPTGPTSFDWVADAGAGTSLIFVMTDSAGRQGGSSDVQIVGISDDTSCINSNSPTSTANPPSATSATASPTASASTTAGSGASTTSAPPAASTTASSGTVSAGVIAGVVIGGLIAAAIIATLLLFFLRNRRNRWPYSARRDSHRLDSVDLAEPVSQQISPYPYTPSTAHMPHSSAPSEAAFFDPRDGTSASYPVPPMPGHDNASYNPYAPSTASQLETPVTTEGSRRQRHQSQHSMSSAGRRKAAMAGVTSYQPPPRFILHNDLEEIMPDENGVVELPPQYSEARKPIAGLAPQVGVQASSSAATEQEQPPTTPPGLDPLRSPPHG